MQYNFQDLQVEATDYNIIRLSYGDRGSETLDVVYTGAKYKCDFEIQRYWRNHIFIITFDTMDDMEVVQMTVNGELAKIYKSHQDFKGNHLYIELFETFVIREWTIDICVNNGFAQNFKPLPPIYNDEWLKVDFTSMQIDVNYMEPCKYQFWYYRLHEYMENQYYNGIILSNHQLENNQMNGAFQVLLDNNKCKSTIDIHNDKNIVVHFDHPLCITKYFSFICIA